MSNKNIVNKERNMFVDDDSVTYNSETNKENYLANLNFTPLIQTS